MTWNSPPTFTVGQKPPAATMNFIKGDLDLLGGPMVTYTTTWGSTGTAPVIGNGSVVAAAMQANKIIDFRVVVTFGSSTTFGTGGYTLLLPVTPVAGHRFSFTGWLVQGGNIYEIAGHCSGSTTMQLYYVSVGTTGQVTNVTPTAPVTLTASSANSFQVSGRYEAA